jgi:Protein of unknown function (DUF1573)
MFSQIISTEAWLLVIACLSSVAAAQDSEKSSEPWANKLFGAPANHVHHFGTVQRGKKLQHEFEVTNIYRVPLEITDIRSGSSIARADADKKFLQPGEKTKIILTLDAGSFTGTRSGAFFVTFGPNFISTAKLTWTANSK